MLEEKDRQKLVCVIMGQNCEKFIGMCLESVKNADAIVYCDGGSTDGTLSYLHNKMFTDIKNKIFVEFGNQQKDIIHNTYDQEDKQMNGKQRNFYLQYVRQKYPDYWCLAIDADEVVEDLSKVKEFIQTAKEGLYYIHMRHFHNDLGHEDSTQEKHYVPNRLFKVKIAGYYPDVEHPILTPIVNNKFTEGTIDCTTIWHLAHIHHCFNIKGRYEKNMKHSNIHTPEFLKQWYYAHLFGQYPNKAISLTDIPEVILKNFHVDKDEFYFANRGIEVKHAIMTKQWNDYFQPNNVLDLGCGRGPYLYFWKWYTSLSSGIEISKWAVNNAFCADIAHGSITEHTLYNETDLITAIDVLEHLDNDCLMLTLNNMTNYGKQFIFSIPFKGGNGQPDDPNLALDKTHKQFRTKDEWIKLIESFGIKIEETPEEWLFAHQILIGRKV